MLAWVVCLSHMNVYKFTKTKQRRNAEYISNVTSINLTLSKCMIVTDTHLEEFALVEKHS